jgi:perosamine synthetase
MPIPYGRQAVDADDVSAVVRVLKGDWLTQGPEVEAFETALAELCAAQYAVAFSSGTAALHASCFAAGLAPGDELVTSAITFAASANCGVYLGATPRFADIDGSTWNVSPETLAKVLTPRTRVVVPVHFAGLPAPIREIRALLADDVVIVEDACHALGAVDDENSPVGSCRYSDMTVFSFHPVKAITSGEGGMVTTRSKELRDRLRLFRSHGITRDLETLERPEEGGWHQEQHELGFNYRLTDIQSALGRSQLNKLEQYVSRRNEIAVRYRDALSAVERVALPPAAEPNQRHAYHIFVIQHREGAEARRRLYEGLRARGILAQVHYLPVYRHPFYASRFGYSAGLCPQAERYYAGCLSIPCFPTLSESDQDEVISAIYDLV